MFIIKLLHALLLSLAEVSPDLGFKIRRTRTNNIPVYTHYRNSGTRAITCVRKVSGDLKVRIAIEYKH